MPAFTTNVEFGEWYRSGKVVLGFPQGADKMRYLEYKASRADVPIFSSLEDAVLKAIEIADLRANS